ncbi:MAG: hypothetical protein HY216_05185 [Candidatus Rokubacteria bacterium]|nr:hypothetical protein [Candidatus Rokubacteria bacterium]
MKLGCCGCLTVLILAGIAGGIVAGAGWTLKTTSEPPALAPPPTTVADGRRAQQKLYDIARHAGGEVTLTDREINALLSRHLAETPRMPLAGMIVGLPAAGEVELAGRVPLSRLVGETVVSYLPTRWGQRSAWIFLRGRVSVERADGDAKELHLDVREWRLGRQRLPAWLFGAALDRETRRVLRWPLPATVESVAIEPGRLTVRTASAR